MAETFHVKTPQEALELAREFKKNGKYDLFRGQNENWALVASINRLSTKKRKEAVKKLWFFKLFLLKYKLTETITEDLDSVMAIAQHYGIPTDLIDFTRSPEVAFFFATHSKKNLNGKEGVILCMNKINFEKIMISYDALFVEQKLIQPYILEIDIDNLWRLQAQDGCFLQLSFGGLEELYAFDKIIFPQVNMSNDICIADIYPENKSDLEIILDNYFAAIKIEEGAKRLMRFADELGIKTTKPPKQREYKYVKSRKAHTSWLAAKINIWKYEVKESFSRTIDSEFELHFKSMGDFHLDIYNINKSLSEIFSENGITKQNKMRL